MKVREAGAPVADEEETRMAIMELNDQEKADLAAAREVGQRLNLAEQTRQLAMSVQRDLLATADRCAAMLSSGEHPAVAAKYAREQGTALVALLGKIHAGNLAAVTNAVALYGYTPAQIDVLYRYMMAGCVRLRDSAKDGSAIAADVVEIANSFTRPTLLWS